MRGLVTGLVACCVLASGGAAVARTEWVVLRVERVEVAVAHADGSPWDDGPMEIEHCRLDGPLSFRPNPWDREAERLCVARGGADTSAPDLLVTLVAGTTSAYMTPVARDSTAHAFGAGFLIPLEIVGSDGVWFEVRDQDGTRFVSSESLGRIKLTLKDIRNLLAEPSRVKTLSDGAVTRFEVTARRYRRGRTRVARLSRDQGSLLTSMHVLAGELIQIRARGRNDNVAVVGGHLSAFSVGRCTRTVADASGGVLVAVDDPGDPASFVVSFGTPSVKQWLAAAMTFDCTSGGTRATSRASVASVSVGNNALTPTSDEVRALLEKRYLQGIRRCHERALRVDVTSVGTVSVLYRILETGAASFTAVNGFDSAVDTCIESLIGHWRFGVPKDANGKPVMTDVDVTLSL